MSQDPSTILVIKLSAIGDLVHSLPFLEVLRERFPKARIDWVVEEEGRQVLEGHPAIAQLFISQRKGWKNRLLKIGPCLSALGEVARFVGRLRAESYELIIDLQGILRSGVLAGLSRGGRKIGMAGAREGAWLFWNEPPVPVDYNQHAIDRYLQFAGYFGCETNGWRGDIPISNADRAAIDGLLNAFGLGDRPLVAFSPVARWETKLWDLDRFAALADELTEQLSCDIVITGSNKDKDIIECIVGRMRKRSVNLAGLTGLKGLGHLYTRCDALVTTDTGPMHIAAAVGCPIVALFGPTAPWRTGPYGGGHRVIRAKTACSPCLKRKCDHVTCMMEITVEAVFNAVKDVFEENQNTLRTNRYRTA